MTSNWLMRRDGFEIAFIIIVSGLVILGIILAVEIPKWNAEHQAELKKIDSLNCTELKKYILAHSKDMTDEETHTVYYNYADAKWHVGDCK